MRVGSRFKGIRINKRGSIGVGNIRGSSGGSGLVGTTWNPDAKNALVTLTNNNLTASDTDIDAVVRSIKSQTTGKYYAEMKLDNLGSGLTVGLANGAASLNSAPGFPVGTTSYNSNTAIYVNGSFIGAGPSVVTNDVIGIIYNGNTKMYWMSKNGVLFAGDPVAGIGGYNISAITGAIFLVCSSAGGTNYTKRWKFSI